MARPFHEILAEISCVYEDLYNSKIALELEVAAHRRNHNASNSPEDIHLMVDCSPYSMRALRPHPGPIALSSEGKPFLLSQSGDCSKDHDQSRLVKLCTRMESFFDKVEHNNVARQKQLVLSDSMLVHSGHSGLQEDACEGRTSKCSIGDASPKRFSLTTKEKSLRQSLTSSSGDATKSKSIERFREPGQSTSFRVYWDGEEDDDKARRTVSSFLRVSRRWLVDHSQKQAVDTVSGFITLTYICFLGTETELQSQKVANYESIFFVIHMIYNSIFLLELLGRLQSAGVSFFTGEGWRMNMLDAFLVLSTALDVVMRAESSGRSARMFRSIRVIRLVRTVRIVRAMGEVREFQKMVFAITSSLKTLFYSIVILFFILYFFAVIFTYAAIEAREELDQNPEREAEDSEDLQKYWGSFFKAIYACFLTVSTGQSWEIVVRPLSNYSTYLTLCFIAFIAVILLGVLNSISAVFVESALLSAQHYKDLIILDKEKEKELAINHMKAVFMQIDEDGSGEIDSQELEYFLSNDQLRKYMEALNVSADDTRMLFRLLDTDGSGIIDIDEFCGGCMKLKGEARAFDMHVMLLQVKQFMEKWSNFTVYVADYFAKMDNRVTVLQNQVKGMSVAF